MCFTSLTHHTSVQPDAKTQASSLVQAAHKSKQHKLADSTYLQRSSLASPQTMLLV